MTTDITNIKKNEKDGYSSTVEKPKVSAMGDSIEKIEKDTKDDLEKIQIQEVVRLYQNQLNH